MVYSKSAVSDRSAFIGNGNTGKVAAIILFALLLLSFTGCGGGAMGSNNATTANGNAAAPTGTGQNTANAPVTAPVEPPAAPAQPPVTPPAPPTPPANQKVIAGIQNMSGWTWCTAMLNGKPCASGDGNATSSMTPGQKTPSLSGVSALFKIGGPTSYSNALWWRELGANAKATHFTYDLYFYMDDPTAPEALEFDVNHTVDGTRYVFGTECSYRHTGDWQIWDTAGGKWFNTDVPCPVVSAKTWHHLVWQFERVGGKAHFISVTLDDQTSTVDKYFDPAKYGSQGVSIAFQLDGDSHQTPYTVWLDKVNLTSW